MVARKSKPRPTPDLRKATTTGQELAARALRRHRAAMRRRQQALAARRDLTVAKGELASAGTLVAEGDSWFDYPLQDVLSELAHGHGYDIESVAHRGDTVEGMAFNDHQLAAFTGCIDKLLRRNIRPRAILLSGGGNDLAGDEFGMLLNHAASGSRGLNEAVVTGVIDQRLPDAYATILGAVTAVCRGLVGEPLPILVHGYDYPVPDGRGFAGGWSFLPGPWLEPGFRSKGYASMTERKAIMVRLIDRFNEMLRRLLTTPEFGHVRYVDLRRTLSNGQDYKDWWANELHPTRSGFTRIAERMAKAIEE